MDWIALRQRLLSRSDVRAVCRRCGYANLDELLGGAARGLADDLIADLVASDGEAGAEVALAVLAPHLRRAARGLHAWTGDDAGELIVAACWERLQRGSLPPRPTRSVVDQARKTVVRELQRSWRRAVATTPLLEAPTSATGPTRRPAGRVIASDGSVEDEVLRRLAEDGLIKWVMQAAELDDQTARIVVHSRAWGVPMRAVAAAEGLAYHTAYRRRARAEHKIRSSVHSGGAPLPMT